MIGDPAASTVYLLTGAPSGVIDLSQYLTPTSGTTTTTTLPSGVIQNGTVTESLFVFDDTIDADALAGFSEAAVGSHTGSASINDIAIGAPGTLSGQGAVYLISSSNTFSNRSTFELQNVGLSTTGGLNGVKIVAPPNDQASASNTTVPPAVTTTPAFLGASVSGLLRITGQTGYTTDQDVIGDLIIGAPGYSLATYPLTTPPASTRTLAGAAFALEGGLLTVYRRQHAHRHGHRDRDRDREHRLRRRHDARSPPGEPPARVVADPDRRLALGVRQLPADPRVDRLRQFRPKPGWLLRMEIFSGKISQKNPAVAAPPDDPARPQQLGRQPVERPRLQPRPVPPRQGAQVPPQGQGHPQGSPAQRL